MITSYDRFLASKQTQYLWWEVGICALGAFTHFSEENVSYLKFLQT